LKKKFFFFNFIFFTINQKIHYQFYFIEKNHQVSKDLKILLKILQINSDNFNFGIFEGNFSAIKKGLQINKNQLRLFECKKIEKFDFKVLVK
jgi:hypothetical protein